VKTTRIPVPFIAAWSACASLALGAYFYTLQSRYEEHAHPLGRTRAADVVGLSLERGPEVLRLEKKDGRWLLQEPLADEADPSAVRALLGSLFKLEIGQVVTTDPEAYPSLGLAETRVRLRVYSARRKEAVLDANFGSEESASDRHYFRFARDGPVHVAAGVETELLGLDAEKFRQREPKVYNEVQSP